MKTKINILLEEFDLVITATQKLTGISYTAKDYSGFVKSLGGEVETFLKDAVFLHQANHKSFFHLIADLSPLGISAGAITDLHNLRVLYNDFKHDPLFRGDLINTLQILKKAKIALGEIKAANLGNVNAVATEIARRTVWIAAWDDYIGGMTEISIFLPNYDIDFPYGYDNFNIDITKWDVFKDHFTATGELKLGAEYISEKAYQVWSANVDLIGAGAFTGDTRELNRFLSSLVNSDKENELLDFLQRPNDTASISVSLIYALFEALKADNWKDGGDLCDEVRLRAAYDHAIPVGSRRFDHFIEQLNPQIIDVNRNFLRDIKQILWLDEVGYAKQTILITIMDAWKTGISADGNLICCMTI